MEYKELTFENIASLIGINLSIIAILFTAFTISRDTKIKRAQFWLDLRKRVSEFDDIHLKLRPGGECARNNSGPSTVNDWARVEAYMGLFEHCYIMLEEKLIDWHTFKKIYSYRLQNIVHNDTIREAKLKNQEISKSWTDFIKLLERLGVEIL